MKLSFWYCPKEILGKHEFAFPDAAARKFTSSGEERRNNQAFEAPPGTTCYEQPCNGGDTENHANPQKSSTLLASSKSVTSRPCS